MSSPAAADSATMLAHEMDIANRMGKGFPEDHKMIRGMWDSLVKLREALSPLAKLPPGAPPDRSRPSQQPPSTCLPRSSSNTPASRIPDSCGADCTSSRSVVVTRGPAEDLVRAYAGAVHRFVKLCKNYALTKESLVCRMASTRRVYEDLLALYERIDEELDVPLRNALGDEEEDKEFKKELDEQRVEEEEQMSVLSKRTSRPFVYSRRGHEPMEALTMLKFEIDYHKKDHSKQHLASMKSVFFSIVRSSNGRVSKIPLWYMPPYYLKFDEKFEEGPLSKVFRGELHDAKERREGPGGQDVAIKTLEVHVDGIDLFRREVELWFGLEHKNVLKLAGASHCSHPTMVLTEWASNSTLHAFLWRREVPDSRRRVLTWSKFREAIQGLEYLRSKKIVHGNLKLNNLLVDGDGVVKVSDFGLGMLQLQNVAMQDDRGKPPQKQRSVDGWRAPECRGKLGRPSFRSDVYSLGMCMIEAFLKTPQDPRTVAIDDQNGFDEDEWDLIKSMVKEDPSLRPSLPDVLKHLDDLVGKYTPAARA